MSSSPFFHPVDGYVYGWLWPNGDWAWWSTLEMALQHPEGLLGKGKLYRRRYVVDEPSPVLGLNAETRSCLVSYHVGEGATPEQALELVEGQAEEVRNL